MKERGFEMTRFDPEICVMNQLIKLMAQLDRHSQIRVLEWAKQRAIDDKHYGPTEEEIEALQEEEQKATEGN